MIPLGTETICCFLKLEIVNGSFYTGCQIHLEICDKHGVCDLFRWETRGPFTPFSAFPLVLYLDLFLHV